VQKQDCQAVRNIQVKQRDDRQLLLLQTLVKLRWLAIIGQTLAVAIVVFILDFEFPYRLCGILIVSSIWLNIVLSLRYPTSFRPTDDMALSLLAYDIVQLGALLYLTGGLQNPFSILLIVPVVISATTHSQWRSLLLGLLVVMVATVLVFVHEPLPWKDEIRPVTPFLYIVGTWVAIVSSLLFTAIYTFRVAEEARRLADALAATELVLLQEQHLSALDGLAAAAAHELGTPLATIALVSKEMQHELETGSPLQEDAKLLRSQARRCQEILQKLTSLNEEGDDHLGRLPLLSMLEEVIAPHRDFGVEVIVETDDNKDKQPVSQRNPGILYGLGNLLENAVDFAHKQVIIKAKWDEETVSVTITDDGPGYSREVLNRIGEPFMTTRSRSSNADNDGNAGGLGLGLFIAKTLLERSRAELEFSNLREEGLGARAIITWPRASLDDFRAKDTSNPAGTPTSENTNVDLDQPRL
jgi:two-component system sensor histidine kinase RegB